MSSSFANASNFVISNSTFTHVAGSQHNYNFAGRPSAASCEAMASFVLTVNSFKHTTENTSCDQQSGEIHIHELRGPRDLAGGAQAHRPVNAQLSTQNLGFQNLREGAHPTQPVIEHPHTVSLLGAPEQTASDGDSPPVAPQTPISDHQPHLTNKNIVHQEHEETGDQPICAENLTSYDTHSSPLPNPETRASNTTSYTLAPPAPASLRPPLPPSSARNGSVDSNGGTILPQSQLQPLSNYHAPPQNPYEHLTLNTDSNLKRPSVGAVGSRRVADDTSHPLFEKNGIVQPPVSQQNRRPGPRPIPYSTAPRHRAYHSYPPAGPDVPNVNLQAQLDQGSYNMLRHESHYTSYNHHSRSEFLPAYQGTAVQSYAPAYYWAPSAPYAYGHFAPVYGGFPPPAGEDGTQDVPGAPPFASHPYYNAY